MDDKQQKLAALQQELDQLRTANQGNQVRATDIEKEIAALSSPEVHPAYQRVQLARHPKRPHSLDYIERLFTDFSEIHGDRHYADDPAIICGMAFFEGQPVMIAAQQKGRDTKQNVHRNFAMPKPEGYRKALRAMR